MSDREEAQPSSSCSVEEKLRNLAEGHGSNRGDPVLRHVQKSSLFPARINVAFPPPSQGIEDVAPQLQHQQKLFGKGGLLLGCPLPDTLTLPGHFFLPRILREQQLRRNQTHIQTHVLWLELPFTPHLGIAAVQPPPQQTRGWQLPEAKPHLPAVFGCSHFPLL